MTTMMTTSELVGWSETNGGQNAHVSDDCMGYWADFPSGTSAEDVLEAYMTTADYSGATADVTVTATIDGETASVVVGVELGTHERCTECGHVQQGQSGQCRECGECSTVTGDEVQS